MPERRMFSQKIIDTDSFLDMPVSTRLLYYDLAMRADDDGFVSSPKRITRIIGCSEDDLRLLVAKQFIIPFDSGVCVITDWRIHNCIKSDRYQETLYLSEKSQLELIGKRYRLKSKSETSLEPKCFQNVSGLVPQDRLGKDRLDKDIPPLPPTGGCASEENLDVKTASERDAAVKKTAAETSSRTRKRKKTGELTEEQQKMFELFWDTYPKKVSKEQAKKAFAKINPDEVKLQEILDGVKRAREFDHRFREYQFIPNPATWLNACGWEDELTESKDQEDDYYNIL